MTTRARWMRARVAAVACMLFALSMSGRALAASTRAGPEAVPHAHAGAAHGDEAARLARLAERLAGCAYDALALAAWGDGVLPCVLIPPGVAEELDEPTSLALLTRAQPPRPRAAWEALRAGRPRPTQRGPAAEGAARAPLSEAGASDLSEASPPRALAPPMVYPATDLDLERACVLMVRESLLARLGPDVRIPADAVRDLLEHAPLPVTNPAADPALARRVKRLEQAGRLSRTDRLEADRVVAEADAARAAAEPWKSRHDAMLARVASLADAEDGRALVAITRRVGSAKTGWSVVSTKDGASSPVSAGASGARGGDEVSRVVRRARSEGNACYALAEVLVGLEPVQTPRIDSMVITGEGRLRVGRSVAGISQESIDAWRRACGLERTAVGWTGISARPRPRPPRIRDAPFGIKPL